MVDHVKQLCVDTANLMQLVIRKWTDSFEKKEKKKEEVWSLSTSRPLMKTDVRTMSTLTPVSFDL